MGIAGLWDVIGKGEIVAIAQYAIDHFSRHRRPLRIAVDEDSTISHHRWSSRFERENPQRIPSRRRSSGVFFFSGNWTFGRYGSLTDHGDPGNAMDVEALAKTNMKEQNCCTNYSTILRSHTVALRLRPKLNAQGCSKWASLMPSGRMMAIL